MPSSPRRTVDVTVTGRVQGVSFRDFAEQEANRLGVAGWVANEPDGSVALRLVGAAEAVEALVDWCGDGPRLARVAGVDVRPGDDAGLASFEVRG